MTDVRYDYAHQVELERLLDAGLCDGMPVGALLLNEIGEALGGTSTFGVRPYLKSVASLVVRAVRKPVDIPDRQATVIHFRSGNFTHHQAIEACVRSGLRDPETIVVLGTGGSGDFHVRDALQCLRTRDVAIALKHALNSRRQIRVTVMRMGIGRSVARRLSAMLFVRVLVAKGMGRFLRTQSETRFVSADFDRGALSAPLFVAARVMNLPTGSVQHGVLLPAETLSEFTPLIADTIGVWGTAVRDQLIKDGESPESVVVVGCPTFRGLDEEPMTPQASRQRDVYLALSEPDIPRERQVVRFFQEIAQANDKFDFKVKLHPGRERASYQWISDEFGIEMVPAGVAPEDIAPNAAAVLITGSSVGVEMLGSGVRVGVIDIPEATSKIGRDYVDFLKVPAVGSVDDFGHMMSSTETCDQSALKAVMDVPDRVAFRTFLGLNGG